jgi:sirohydrochlorin ferrochelatase
MTTGIIIVDHGSRSTESNALLHEVADRFAARVNEHFEIVEPAHMELADPDIAEAYTRCVGRGATRIIVCPMFFGRGKHWHVDIPSQVAQAAKEFPNTRYQIAAPLGADDLLLDLLAKRAFESLGINANQSMVLSI